MFRSVPSVGWLMIFVVLAGVELSIALENTVEMMELPSTMVCSLMMHVMNFQSASTCHFIKPVATFRE